MARRGLPSCLFASLLFRFAFLLDSFLFSFALFLLSLRFLSCIACLLLLSFSFLFGESLFFLFAGLFLSLLPLLAGLQAFFCLSGKSFFLLLAGLFSFSFLFGKSFFFRYAGFLNLACLFFLAGSLSFLLAPLLLFLSGNFILTGLLGGLVFKTTLLRDPGFFILSRLLFSTFRLSLLLFYLPLLFRYFLVEIDWEFNERVGV